MLYVKLLKDVNHNGTRLDYSDYLKYLEGEKNSSLRFLQEPTHWPIIPNLTKKVTKRGVYCPFRGDTLIFPVKEREAFVEIQRKLYRDVGESLAAPLDPEYFHITLHDLNNEIDIHNKNKLSELMSRSGNDVKRLFKKLATYFKKYPDQEKIKLKAIGFIGPPIGIAVLFAPSGERDFKLLLNLFNTFQSIVNLVDPLKPHLSLGYFLPEEPTKEIKLQISKALSTTPKIELELDIAELEYSEFTDMNHYTTKFKLKDFG